MNETSRETVAKKALKKVLASHRVNYVDYVQNVLGVTTLEPYQKKVLKTVQENDRTAVSACHDVGKSFLAARIAIAFLTTNKFSKVITTAPTYNQVKRILWSELRSAVASAKIPLGGKLNETDWTIEPEWFALGFTPKNEVTGGEGQGTQSSFQGFHAPGGILVIFDEATGIPHNIWTMAEGLLTQSNVKFLAIGNPTSTASEFYQCFRDQAWAKVYLNCFDSPNLIANGITTLDLLKKEVEKYKGLNDAEAKALLNSYKVTRPYLLTLKWVVQNVAKWGFDHPLTVSKVLGKFPKAGEHTLVPLGFIEEAQIRVAWPDKSDRKIIGIDVARFGTDSTVLTALHGKKQIGRKELFKRDGNEVTGEAIAWGKELFGDSNADLFVVDETGVGGAVVDNLNDAIRTKTLPKGCEVRGVQFGAACESDEDKEKFVNIKARMFSLLADDIKAEDGLALIDDSVYADELPTIRYSYDKKGRLYIESKDEYKKRTGRKSPDNADSLALANFGRYDELTAGAFTKSYVNESGKKTNRPMSGGLRDKTNW